MEMIVITVMRSFPFNEILSYNFHIPHDANA